VEILLAIAGALSIYLGYRLFCDCAHQQSRFRHLMSGALLAVFGLGLLIADIHTARAAAHRSHSAWHRNAAEERSFEPPKINRRGNTPQSREMMRMA
jgi:hypothetical protein